MMRSHTVDDCFGFLVLTQDLDTDVDMRALIFVVECLADIMQQSGSLGKLDVQSQLTRHQSRELRDLYRQYVGDYELLRNMTVEEAIGYAHEQWAEGQRMQKLEMLAELLYAEGSYKQQPLRGMLLDKAFRLYDYVDGHSSDFSIARKQRIAEIQGMIARGTQK